MCCAAAAPPTQSGSKKVHGKVLYLLLGRLLVNANAKTTEQYLCLGAVSKFPTTTKYSWLELVNDGRSAVLKPYQQLYGSAPKIFCKTSTK